jgi:hypothetical protein
LCECAALHCQSDSFRTGASQVYQYHEPDHTTPLFGNGGKDCGTLCKLKELVKKTRKNISKELDAALEH